MIEIEEDDLPGVTSWWQDAAIRMAARSQDRRDRKVDGVYLMKQRQYAASYYGKHAVEIGNKRKAKHAALSPEQKAEVRAKRAAWYRASQLKKRQSQAAPSPSDPSGPTHSPADPTSQSERSG